MVTRDNELDFPDGPRSELDQLLSDLVTTAHKVQGTQGRLRSLLQATQDIVEETDVVTVLRRIVEAAVDLVGARYGALGIIAPDGHLEQFIHVGMSDEVVASIGHLPQGHGILGALIDDPHPIRLEYLSDDPRSSGFPLHHPPMESFLGVPVRVRDEIYGNLYLTEQETGSFTPEDKQLLASLAATAGIAIDNARLLDETRLRQRWSAASAEIAASLIDDDALDALSFLVRRVGELSDADQVMVILPVGDGDLIVEAAHGVDPETVTGLVFAAAGSIAGRAIESAQPVLVDAVEADESPRPQFVLGPTMAIPLVGQNARDGVLTVGRRSGRARFLPVDIEVAADFAGKASLAIELGRARADSQRLAIVEDRSRIARDLHDHVIQRLFGAGLGLQALSSAQSNPVLKAGLDQQIDVLDDAIAQIRTAIFALTGSGREGRSTVRHRVLDLLSEVSESFAKAPRVVFTGAVDALIPLEMGDDVLAVVREGLANVARHSGATETSVAIVAEEDRIVVEVVDNGVGLAAGSDRRSGIANLQSRAERWSGSFAISSPEAGGTVLCWTARLTGSAVSR